MRRDLPGSVVGLAIAIMILAGCGGRPQVGSDMSTPTPHSSASPSLSSTDLPTLKPPVPPKTPTDSLPTDWVVGIVTTTGSGPCYGLETNDGKLYALYSASGMVLTRGETVRVKIEPLRLKIYCGPGQHASIVTLERVH